MLSVMSMLSSLRITVSNNRVGCSFEDIFDKTTIFRKMYH